MAQVDVRGLIATAFDHYDSRAGDPHLHTHVVISNKVQTVLDGKWRSLDGRPMHAATVALSELREARFADHLTRAFGVEWEARDMGRDRNPAWAVTAVPEELVVEFSSRSRHIDVEKNCLIAEYVEKYGRQPSTATIIKLRAQATLTTRPEKQVRSLADLTAEWRERVGWLLGTDATAWARRVTTKEAPLLLRADDIPLDVIASLVRDRGPADQCGHLLTPVEPFRSHLPPRHTCGIDHGHPGSVADGVDDEGIGDSPGRDAGHCPGPVGPCSDLHTLLAQDADDRLDCMTLGAHLIDERARHRLRGSSSPAKKVVAAFKIATSSRRRLFSALSRLISAASSLV